jgi:hypothetical protein
MRALCGIGRSTPRKSAWSALSKFCPADHIAGIYGALVTNNLDGSYYKVCWNSQSQP